MDLDLTDGARDTEIAGKDPHNAPNYSADEPASTPSLQSPRAASRCTRCLGRPLRSQCRHTKAGEAYLREKEVLEASTVFFRGFRLIICIQDLNRHSQQMLSTGHDLFMATSHSVDTPVRPGSSSALFTPVQTNPVPAMPSIGYIFPPAISSGDNVPPAHTIHAPSSPPHSATPPADAITTVPQTPAETPVLALDSGTAEPTSNSGEEIAPRQELSSSKRPRATAANAIYGFVEGVYRGPEAHCEY